MDSKLTTQDRHAIRIVALSRQLREAEMRESTLRQDNDVLQARIANLIAQLHEPHSIDDVIHLTDDRPGQGS